MAKDREQENLDALASLAAGEVPAASTQPEMPKGTGQENLDALASLITDEIRAASTERRMADIRQPNGPYAEGEDVDQSGRRRPRYVEEAVVESVLDMFHKMSPQHKRRQKVIDKYRDKRKNQD